MKRRFLLPACLLAVTAGPSWAQSPQIDGVFPAAGRIGASTDLNVSGKALSPLKAVLVSGSGVTAAAGTPGSATAATIRVSVDAKAEPGPREIRLVTENGASNAARIWIDAYQSVVEKEPNDTPAQAMALPEQPIAVDGRQDKPQDRDCFAFKAVAGETWVFRSNAARHRSDTDFFMALLDSRGRWLAHATDGFGRDPYLKYTFKTSDKYILRVRDTLYRGGAGYTYRVTMGKVPEVTRWSPLAVTRGASVNLALKGSNLEGAPAVTAAAPQDPSVRSVKVIARTALGATDPIELPISEGPVLVEHEPNNDLKTATPISASPQMVSGWMDQNQDRDLFTFIAKEKQVVRLEVLARRLGSRLDAVLRVLDSTGKELAKNDDAVAQDPRLIFTAPAAGAYFVEIVSVSGRGDDDYRYLLEIGNPPPPGFALTVTPDNPTAPAGAAVPLTINAVRSGYNGEIALRVEGLPNGVVASPASLPAGKNSTLMTLSAPSGIAPSFAPIRLIGSAKIGESAVEVVARPQESYQPPLTNQPNQRQARSTEFFIAAAGTAPKFLLSAPATAQIKAAEKAEVVIKLTRAGMFKGKVAVTVLGLPPNVTASALTIDEKNPEGKITLTAAKNAATGVSPLVFQGASEGLTVSAPVSMVTVLAPK